MKTRQGFVSNSSSSSFVCDVCGASESGWDASLSDFDMYECENGHTFCADELVKPVDEKYLDEDSPDFDEDMVYNYGVPEECCPVCSFQSYSEPDMVTYLKKKFGDDTDEAFAEAKAVNSRRKKLYSNEYVFYACKKHGTTVDAEFEEIKNFGSYSKFKEWLRS